MFRKLCGLATQECQMLYRTHQSPSFNVVKFSTVNKNTSEETIEEIVAGIDTTLTADQQAYVNSIKKLIRGGPNAPRSLYREVPRPDEIVGLGNFMPKYADNAEALIDYAISHIPKKTGPRNTKKKKRMYLRWETKRKHDAIKKEQMRQKNLKHHAKLKRIRQEVLKVQQEAAAINERRATKASLKQ